MYPGALLPSIGIGIGSFLLFLMFQATGIYAGDSGDLVTAAATIGVPHPPGYPLYTFLGWLATRIPYATVAWRVGLLSSLPHAATSSLLYLFVYRVTKRAWVSVCTVLSLVGTYIFFLYSVTPEVFALFDMFVVVISYLLYLWVDTKNVRYLYAASFFFGLSLTHHHVILFLMPAIIFVMYNGYKRYKNYNYYILFLVFLLGLLPYLYIPIAARGSAMINWDRAVDVSGFIRLVSRADYGTFISGGAYGATVSQRLLALKAYVQFMLLDFTPVVFVCGVVGLGWLYRRKRPFFWYILPSLMLLGPGFFFYASFPFVNRFTLGTFERFLLPSYVLWIVCMGIGLSRIIEWIGGKFTHRRIVISLCTAVLFVYPLTRLGMTVWRFWGLPADRTAQRLGEDMLGSVPAGGILILGRDTPLFTTQYVRYALGVRPDVALVHFGRLSSPEYYTMIAQSYPHLRIPAAPSREQTSALLSDFIRLNRESYEIFTNIQFSLDEGWFWVPHGLVYRLLPAAGLPSLDAFEQTNAGLWNQYAQPGYGILTRYTHLMLADVWDVYADMRIELGRRLLKGNKVTAAQKAFASAIAWGGDTRVSDAYLYHGLTELFLQRCGSALASFAKARETAVRSKHDITLYESITYRDCLTDPARAIELFDASERERVQEETPLSRE